MSGPLPSPSPSAWPPGGAAAPAGAAAPWLSVLIPVHNVKDYLRECLDSVLAQADAGVEVLMVDDCSTDGSDDLVRTLVTEHAAGPVTVRGLFHAQNQGLSGARNTMLQAARGDYVWFVDSDDYLMPGAIPRLRQVVRGHAPALVLCDFFMLRERMKLKHRLRGELHRRTFFGPERQVIRDPSLLMRGLFEAGQMHSWSKIARRSVWGEQLRFPVGRYFEDMATTPFLALLADSVWYEPEVWVAYRQRAGSILATPNVTKAEHLAHALANLRDAAAGTPLDDETRFAWAHFAARNFIGASRMADKALPDGCAEAVAKFRDAFEEASPIPLRDLDLAYKRRGWFVRAMRLRHWLRRADCEGSPSSGRSAI
ncbi:glycosyltransferase family 2 protein [Roseateles chitinivorans]|uniref:glycosyltransferase family 2 protein n=1 Tax=Roseateles chitinivorans TaxID=2917965 RepID=UPI003D663D68